MTETLLTAEDCAACQRCCIFESYELRMTPVVDDALAALAKRARPDVRFADVDGVRLFLMTPVGDDMFACPMLDPENGCILGKDKPPECRMFPFVITEKNGRRAVAVSSACPLMNDMEETQLAAAAKAVSAELFALADKRPELIRRYEKGFTVLVTEQTGDSL